MTRKDHAMKPSLAPGLAATSTMRIDRDRTIDFMGEQARVYATPMLVRDIEIACRELLLAHRVDVDVDAPPLQGNHDQPPTT